MKTGIELITEERQRQIKVKGFSASYDNERIPGELLAAGVCYSIDALSHSQAYGFLKKTKHMHDDEIYFRLHKEIANIPYVLWPRKFDEWKPTAPKDTVRQLVKAGALIAAEIDRIERVGYKIKK